MSPHSVVNHTPLYATDFRWHIHATSEHSDIKIFSDETLMFHCWRNDEFDFMVLHDDLNVHLFEYLPEINWCPLLYPLIALDHFFEWPHPSEPMPRIRWHTLFDNDRDITCASMSINGITFCHDGSNYNDLSGWFIATGCLNHFTISDMHSFHILRQLQPLWPAMTRWADYDLSIPLSILLDPIYQIILLDATHIEHVRKLLFTNIETISETSLYP